MKWSLVNFHSSVFQYNGQAGTITDLEWEPAKEVPSKVRFQRGEGEKSYWKSPAHLFQGCSHFVFGQIQQHKARMALEELGHQCTHSLVHFLLENAVECSFHKLENVNNQFDYPVGTSVRLLWEQLRLVGEQQNSQLTPGHLAQFNGQQASRSCNLLIIACSATKNHSPHPLSALLRYTGSTYLLLKSILLGNQWPPPVYLILVFTKYGLLRPLECISFYDQRLYPELLHGLQTKVKTQQEHFDLPPWMSVL